MKWISPVEELPSIDNDVLVYLVQQIGKNTFSWMIRVAQRTKYGWVSSSGEPIKEPSYWMDLPLLPPSPSKD